MKTQSMDPFPLFPLQSEESKDWGQTWLSLALSWAEQELTCAQLELAPNSGQLAPTWAQLGSNMAQLGHACATWSRVGASGAEVVPKTSPMWATRHRTGVCSVKSGLKLTDRSIRVIRC